MPNANRDKGTRAELDVFKYVQEFFPESWKTRDGWDADRGDVVLDLLGDKVLTWAIQVKDVGSPSWKDWFHGLGEQIRNGSHQSGVIWWKLRGKANPADWRVVMTGRAYMDLMSRIRFLEEHLDGIGADGKSLR